MNQQFLGRLSVRAQQLEASTICAHRLLVLSVFPSTVCLSVIRVTRRVCMWHTCVLCAYWEYIFSLTRGRTWQDGAAAASPLFGCQTWHDTVSSNTRLPAGAFA